MSEHDEQFGSDDSGEVRELASLAVGAANEPETTAVESDTPIHPAYTELLSQIPESLRGVVTPKLAEYQRKADERFQEVHSTYQPYKTFLDNKVDVQDLQNGYAMLEALRSNPRAVFDQMQAHYKFVVEQGQEEQVPEEQYDNAQIQEDPRYTQLQTQMQQMMQSQLASQQQAQASQEIDQAFTSLRTAHPGLDNDAEQYIGMKASMLFDQHPNATPDQVFKAAYEDYATFTSKFAPKPTAPRVPSGTSSLPSTVKPTEDMSPSERRAAAIEMMNLIEGS